MEILETRTVWTLVIAFLIFALVPQAIYYGVHPEEFTEIVYGYVGFDFFVKDFVYHASDVNISETNIQNVAINVDIERPFGGIIQRQLFLLVNEEKDEYLLAQERELTFTCCQPAFQFNTELPEDIEVGTYKWVVILEIYVTDELTKTKAFESNNFQIVR